MENQQSSTTVLCRAGCGFYGSNSFEGLCSVCFKKAIKDNQSGHSSASATTSATTVINAHDAHANSTNLPPFSKVDAGAEDAEGLNQSAPAVEPSIVVPEVTLPMAKKNRCQECKKRVGLTGFSCRCGGMYCAEHRYDNAHDCKFDYKTMEREQLRKDHPAVVSEKIQRI
ncbi:unnamed protein product, partial [Mesorhabditis spiculigera]